jgi:hypothetical protein
VTTVEGRRIYVHESSFDSLARTSHIAAEEVSLVMKSTAALKVIHHHVTDVGVDLGLVDRAEADALEIRLRAEFGTPLTSLLRRVGHRPRIPAERDRFDPVLAPWEDIVASCHDSGYLTFATDDASSRIMYSDHDRLHDLWVQQMSNAGPADLTMIKGRSLTYIVEGIPTGAGAGERYATFIKQSVVTPAEVESAMHRATRRVLDTVRTAVASLPSIDPQVAGDALAAATRALHGNAAASACVTATQPACGTDV